MPLDKPLTVSTFGDCSLRNLAPKLFTFNAHTVADAISRLDIRPILSEHENWMTFTKCCCHYTMQDMSAINTSAYQDGMNLVFANRSKEDESTR